MSKTALYTSLHLLSLSSPSSAFRHPASGLEYDADILAPPPALPADPSDVDLPNVELSLAKTPTDAPTPAPAPASAARTAADILGEHAVGVESVDSSCCLFGQRPKRKLAS